MKDLQYYYYEISFQQRDAYYDFEYHEGIVAGFSEADAEDRVLRRYHIPKEWVDSFDIELITADEGTVQRGQLSAFFYNRRKEI